MVSATPGNQFDVSFNATKEIWHFRVRTFRKALLLANSIWAGVLSRIFKKNSGIDLGSETLIDFNFVLRFQIHAKGYHEYRSREKVMPGVSL